jgi:queuosine precursor transporter
MTAALIVAGCYLATQILSDISSLRIVTLFGLSMDAGTLVYPLTFTLRDLVHKTAGIRAARAMIGLAAAVNLFMAGLFWLVARLPADPAAGTQTAFGTVLSPVWRIVLASIAAEVVSELLDTEAYRFWVSRVSARRQWMRVLFSNSISIPVDSLLFCWLAFGAVYSNSVVWSIVVSNVLLKMATTVVSVPLIYAVKERRRP